MAYTFDAGPNACLYLLEKDVPMMMSVVRQAFPPSSSNGNSFLRGPSIEDYAEKKVRIKIVNIDVSVTMENDDNYEHIIEL